jgi:hypothetical protein
MFPTDGMEDNNNSVIIKEPLSYTRIHEHDFVSITTEREQTSTICSTCGSLYCEKCGKLVNDV